MVSAHTGTFKQGQFKHESHIDLFIFIIVLLFILNIVCSPSENQAEDQAKTLQESTEKQEDVSAVENAAVC